MFLVSVIRSNFLKSSIRILHPFKRNFLTKKSRGVIDGFSGRSFLPNFEAVQNSRPTLKGFEVIYLTPLESYVKWTCWILPFFWAGFCVDGYRYCTNEKYLEELSAALGKVSHTEKMLHFGVTLALGVILQLFIMRTVMVIFRKGNEFKTLTYGLFGPLTKKYTPHGNKAMEPTSWKVMYCFKGKYVLVFSNGFSNYKDFNSVVKTDIS